MKYLLTLLISIVSIQICISQSSYKVITMRAAPGELEQLIEAKKKDIASFNKAGEANAYMVRHSQGDQWDLMIMFPIASIDGYYSGESHSYFDKPYGDPQNDLIAWQEEAFVTGPAASEFESYFSGNNFFHIEMFISLPGKQAELKKEREMENEYLEYTSRKPNLVFTKVTGFEYDIFTVGAYGNLIEYAEGGNQPEEVQEKAAVKAGFKSASDIGFYLRALLSEHHDTLANKVAVGN